MKKYVLILLISISVISFLTCQSEEMNEINNSTVENFDLSRYLGTWYEIARFQHSFEKDLVGVTANYSLRDDGKIEVANSGYKESFSGKYKSITGKAKIPDPSNPAHLKVSFFLFFYADYYILEIDQENYSYALVGSSSDKYLWILSRTPFLTDEVYDILFGKAKDRGYDVRKLFKVPQKEQI